MRPDGSLDPKRITPLVYTPTSVTLTPSIVSDENHYRISFSAEGDGYYTAIADMSAVIFSKTDEGYQIAQDTSSRTSPTPEPSTRWQSVSSL